MKRPRITGLTRLMIERYLMDIMYTPGKSVTIGFHTKKGAQNFIKEVKERLKSNAL